MVAAGTQLGPYQIISRLGAGGMGEVYRAKDLRLDREVAIKVLPASLSQDSDALARFEREARALAALSHANILTIYDFNNDQEISYAVMELLEGETLRTRLKRAPIDWQTTIKIAIAVAEGLIAAHSKGVIHRDLKPDNIFLTPDGGVKILDFGLARVQHSTLSTNSARSGNNSAKSSLNINTDSEEMETVKLPRAKEKAAHQVDTDQTKPNLISQPIENPLTEPGTVMGTVPYMSPEQLQGETIDARSDIFSFGSMLYEMVAGVRPFDCATNNDTMDAILESQPVKITKINNQIPAALDRVVMRCLEKDRNRRYQSALELQTALKALLPNRVQTLMLRVAVIALLLLLSVSGFYLWSQFNRPINSIAVLPLVNYNGDPNNDYLSDGISESIIDSLSQLPKLRVIARSIAFRYKGRNIDPQQAGRELQVETVLIGRITRQGEDLDIDAELVKVDNGTQLWHGHYRGQLAEILKVELEIGKQIATKLGMRLPSAEQQQRLTKYYPTNTEAYQLYLKGQFYSNKSTREGVEKSIDYFNQAITTAPNYALAYAGLAKTYVISSGWYLPPREALPKAKAAASQALELDNTLAEAHTWLAWSQLEYELDWRGAEREFQRTIEANPDYLPVHSRYGRYLAFVGRYDEAIAEMKRAQQAEPLSLNANANLGLVYFFARRYDDAIDQLNKTLELDNNFLTAHLFLGMVYEQTGQFDRAIKELQRARELDDGPDILGALGYLYSRRGDKAEALKIIAELNREAQQRYVSPYFYTLVYLGMNDKTSALQYLEQAEQQRSQLTWLKADPRLDILRDEPRFNDLIKRVGLAQ